MHLTYLTPHTEEKKVRKGRGWIVSITVSTVSVPPPPLALDPAHYVVARLEEAGAAMLALPQSGYSTRLSSGALEIVRDWRESYGWGMPELRAPRPSAEQISAMDEAFAWIGHIPPDRRVWRRVVGARALVNPLTDRHLFTWRRLGRAIGADHRAVKNWHAKAIDLIVAALFARKFLFPS